MRLKEYEAKNIFRKYGISVPKGFVFKQKLNGEINNIKYPVMLKAQILSGGRGKAGGIKLIKCKKDLNIEIENMLNKKILGHTIEEILIEESFSVDQELFISCTISRKDKKYILMVSDKGGVDIENEAESVSSIKIDPLLSLRPYHLKVLLSQFKFAPTLSDKLEELLISIYNMFLNINANTVEINPLGVIGSNIYALDAKIILDDAAVDDSSSNKFNNNLNFSEVLNQFGLHGGIWDGEIAVLCGGAGRMMAILDLIIEGGGTIKAFGELGTLVSQKSSLEQAMSRLLPALHKLNPKVIFFNVFFVLAKCDDFANALVKAYDQCRFNDIPIVLRIEGNGEEKALKILKNSSMDVLLEKDLIKATEKVLMFGKGINNVNFNK